MNSIAHISADFPDPFRADKTVAVQNLVRHSGFADHFVISLNRTVDPFGSEQMFMKNGVAVRYFGLPYGMGLKFSMTRLGDHAAELLTSAGYQPTLIHAHKLAFEGLAGLRLAECIKVPLIVTMRGNTDAKVLKFRPDLRKTYAEILERSMVVFTISPWIRSLIERLFGVEVADKIVEMPNIVPLQSPATDLIKYPSGRFVSAFSLDQHRIKNARRLIKAISIVRAKGGVDLRLDIFGGGSVSSIARIKKWIKEANCESAIVLKGRVPNERLQQELGRYHCFVMPSLSDSFGFVYIEALNAGLPIIYPDNAGIAGSTVDDQLVGRKVNPRSIESIAEAILEVHSRQTEFSINVMSRRDSGWLDQFSASSVVDLYQSHIRRAVDLLTKNHLGTMAV